MNSQEMLVDERSRNILSNKRVLANVMKAVIPEYQNLSISEIVELIEDGGDSRNVKGIQNEDIRVEGAKIIYDVLFTAKLPNSEDSIGLYIDVESQNVVNPGYPLLKRAIYYSSRLIARQKNESFSGSDYGKLRKVYTIWICFNPGKNSEDTINHYCLSEEHLKGEYHEHKDNYDIPHIIMMNVGKKKTMDSSAFYDILDMFRIIFLEKTLLPECKIDILNENFDIMFKKEDSTNMPIILEEWKIAGYQYGLEDGARNATVDNVLKLVETGMPVEEALSRLAVDDSTADLILAKLNENK
ncbi:MAG: PD-(D/E)XK nuclease family transposase [Erysipelotrichaceae bacterium]|nr:PD-(D/E)XK nuclease family transposase [Erysipelotrichaceae bacterium]